MSPRVSIKLLAAQPDGRLVDLVGSGNERAFEALVSRYRDPLLRYCARMGLSDAVAEEVVQHSLLKAWLALIDGTKVRELRPWLYRIVHNLAISSIRGTREEAAELPETAEHGILGATPAGPEDRLAAREALGHVAALPDMQRNAIVLTAIEGRSHEEAASVLGITDGAVRGLIHRARTSMRAAAAAFMPPGLQAWLSRGSEAVPLSERSGELTAGAGILGLTGVLAKGAVVAATAGLVIAGGSAVQGSRHSSSHHQAAQPTVSAAAGLGTTSDVVSLRSPATRHSAPDRGRGRSGAGSGEEHRSDGARHGEHTAPRAGGSIQTELTRSGESSQDSGERLSTRRDGSGDGSGSSGRRSGESGRDSGGGSGSGTPSSSGDSGSGDSGAAVVLGEGTGSSGGSADGGTGGDSAGGGSGSGGNDGSSGGDGSGARTVEATAESSSHGGSTPGGEPH